MTGFSKFSNPKFREIEKSRRRTKSKFFVSNWIKIFIDFVRDFFADLLTFFMDNPSNLEDDDLRWRTVDSTEFGLQTGFKLVRIWRVILPG